MKKLLIIFILLTLLPTAVMATDDLVPVKDKKIIAIGQNSVALLEAARTGNLDSVESLLKQPVDINAQDRHGYTALKWASMRGYNKIEKLLLDKGAKSELEIKYGNKTIKDFEKAAKLGQLESIIALSEVYSDSQKSNYFRVEYDVTKGHKYKLLAANLGHADSMHRVGNSYYYNYKSKRRNKDMIKALEWYQKAAEMGHLIAQKQLGTIYYMANVPNKGEVVSKMVGKDGKETIIGKPRQYDDTIYTSLKRDVGKGIFWMERAAKQGSADEQITLVKYLFNEKRYYDAYKWMLVVNKSKNDTSFVSSMKNQSDKAKQVMKEMFNEMFESEKNQVIKGEIPKKLSKELSRKQKKEAAKWAAEFKDVKEVTK